MTPKPSLISRIDCSRAIETFLAAGMVWSPDAPTDVVAITDAYYYALKDLTKDQLDRGIERIITNTRDDAKPWIPAANKVRWTIEELDRKATPIQRGKQTAFVVRAFAVDGMGPLVRAYGEGEHTEYPAPEGMRCGEPGCACEAVNVWIPGAAFGVLTQGWGARWVWAHVALARDLKRVADGLPFEKAR